MKKNHFLVGFLAVLVLCQLGFEWGSQATEKKSTPAKAPAALAKASNLPFPQMMGALTQNMTLWPVLDADNKKKSVETAILIFRDRQNSAILRPAEFYVAQIDQAIVANSDLQQADLLTLVKMMSVMQYDFYNGQDKDALAKEVLGEQMYQNIRTRRQK